jgi:DNA-binding NarL/FixJ family response regulator
MTEPGVETIERWYAAFDSRDLGTLLDLTHPEIEITPAGPKLARLPGARFHGPEGVQTFMKWAFEQFPDTRVVSTNLRRVVAGILARATYSVDGSELAEQQATSYAMFRLVDGRIYRIHAFRDESDALEFAATTGALTAREREILQLLLDGLNGRQIADALVLSPLTVRTHVRNAIGRLGARTRIEAVSLALRAGEIHL